MQDQEKARRLPRRLQAAARSACRWWTLCRKASPPRRTENDRVFSERIRHPGTGSRATAGRGPGGARGRAFRRRCSRLNTGTAARHIDQAQAESAIGVSPRFDIRAMRNSLAVDTGGFAIPLANFGRALDDIQRDAGTLRRRLNPGERHLRRQVPRDFGESEPPRSQSPRPEWLPRRCACGSHFSRGRPAEARER